MVQPHNSNKKGINHWQAWKWTTLKRFMLKKRSQTENATLYDSIYMTFWKTAGAENRWRVCEELQVRGKG
jgi:hypothetical protein